MHDAACKFCIMQLRNTPQPGYIIVYYMKLDTTTVTILTHAASEMKQNETLPHVLVSPGHNLPNLGSHTLDTIGSTNPQNQPPPTSTQIMDASPRCSVESDAAANAPPKAH